MASEKAAKSLINHPDLLLRVKELLEYEVIGCPEEFTAHMDKSLRVYLSGLEHPKRPAGVFFLAGPTGSGKTYSVEIIAQALHYNDKLLRIDCGEYQLEHEVARLVGAPPGYLGHRETQSVFSKVGQFKSDYCSLSVILFDEIEKASHSLIQILLGILDYGFCTTGDNIKVSFKDTLIFFTSNIFTDLQKSVKNFGFEQNSSITNKDLRKLLGKKLNSLEFVNRINNIIMFPPVEKKNLDLILSRLIEKIENRLNDKYNKKISIEITKKYKEILLTAGYSKDFGVRELSRVVENLVLMPIAEYFLLDKDLPSGLKIIL